MQHDNDEFERNAPAAVAGGARRKRYDCPRIVSRERLEVLASTCDPAGGGKSSMGDPTCSNFLQS